VRSTRGRRIASAVLTVGLVTAAAACTQPPPDFYIPPGSPSGEPGAVLRVEPSSFGGSNAHTAVAVQYRSTTATGEPNAVTGTVVVPNAPWTGEGERPIVSHAVGTQGLGDHCAPSKSIGGGTVYEQGAFQAMLDRGWAVAVTDYEKLGGPGDHTYVVAAAEAHAVLDIVRAAMQVDELGLDPSAPVGILGYSQGGQAAAKVAEVEGTYAPELDVKGVVAGGVPSDLADLAAFLDGGPFFTFLGYAAIGLNSAYPELDLESYLNADGEALLDTARGSCLADGLLIGAFQSIGNLTTSDPLEQPDWQARLAENQLGSSAPDVPVLQYHAVFDEIIPFDQGTRLRDAWCDGGAQVRWSEYWLAEHAIGIFAGQQESIDFLADRFAGQPFQPTCNA
jgi:pimeloyl-ACP methyl ester carboxylesterase